MVQSAYHERNLLQHTICSSPFLPLSHAQQPLTLWCFHLIIEFSVSQHIQMAYYLSIPLNLFSRPAQALLVCSHKKCWCSRIHVCFYFVMFISFTWTEFFVNGTELFRKFPLTGDFKYEIRCRMRTTLE